MSPALAGARGSAIFSDMVIRLHLGDHFDAFIEAQVASGRYADADELLREALRLLERRSTLESALREGLDDADAGRVRDGDAVFDELLAELEAAPHSAAG